MNIKTLCSDAQKGRKRGWAVVETTKREDKLLLRCSNLSKNIIIRLFTATEVDAKLSESRQKPCDLHLAHTWFSCLSAKEMLGVRIITLNSGKDIF